MIETLIAFTLLINAERVQPLMPDLTLSNRALVRAEYLCAHQQWSHDHWIDSFKGLKDVVWAGENLYCTTNPGQSQCLWSGQASSQSIHQMFMGSPTHKANVVNPHYRKVGVGQSCGITVELFTN